MSSPTRRPSTTWRSLAHLTAHDAALASLREVVDGGYWCYPALATDHWLDGVRGTPAFQAVLNTARDRHETARKLFDDAGGDALLRRT